MTASDPASMPSMGVPLHWAGMHCPVGAAFMRVEAVRTGWPADCPVDGRFRPGAPCESGSAHWAAAGKMGTNNWSGPRPPRGRARSHNEGGGSGDRPPTGTGRASWLAAHASRFRWWSWPGAPPSGRNFLIPDTHSQRIRATMGFCKWAAPTFLREWRANEWVSQMCPKIDSNFL